MTTQSSEKRVLAFDVRPRRFGFVAFEGPERLLDWGIRSFFSGANAPKTSAEQKIAVLLDDFSPSFVIVRERKRHTDKMHLLETIRKQAANRRIPLRFISQKAIVKAFGGTEKNRHEVASALAQQFGILMSKLPPRRKFWQTEEHRMSIFDAAAAGVAYFARYRNGN